MAVNIAFADLTHTGHSCNSIPYGIASVASYALQIFKNEIDVRLFKSPKHFSSYLEESVPEIICFSNYIWNLNISCEYARRIKSNSPQTIIIFGGPNYPVDKWEQQQFLMSRPYIDFYVWREGEFAFAKLLKALFEHNIMIDPIKNNHLSISNCHYIHGQSIVRGEMLPLKNSLDSLPSPYLTGLCDQFLDQDYIPLLQSTRGCPFTCLYCQEGNAYYKKIRRFSSSRLSDELHYIAKRTTVPLLICGDSNLGMYKQDVSFCEEIGSLQKEYGWPECFIDISGKNRKERVIQCAHLIKGSYWSAAVQSTDKQVLKNIKRKNVSLNQMIEIAKEGEKLGQNTFSEVILCLPGDTKDAHFKSICDLIDAGINVVRSHQFIMLPAAEASMKKIREKYNIATRFRITPKTSNWYNLFGEAFFAPEIDEICVENKTMTFDDYLQCRLFNLTVEIFYNNGIFHELTQFLKLHDISISSFILEIHNRIQLQPGPLSDVYNDFYRESNELWSSTEALESFLKQPGAIDRYISEELGNNEQLLYQAIAIFKHMEDLHRIAFHVAKQMLSESIKFHFKKQYAEYLDELVEFSLMCKKDFLSAKAALTKHFTFNFISLVDCNFEDDPLLHYQPEGLIIDIGHTQYQTELIDKYVKIYGLSNFGLGNILSNASHVNTLYRKVTAIGQDLKAKTKMVS